jgi:hypothetical protein
MIPDYTDSWLANGAHAATPATGSEGFIAQYVLPLFFRRTTDYVLSRLFRRPKSVLGEGKSENIFSEEQFWDESGKIQLAAVNLNRFRLTDWFPRAPGVYGSKNGRKARANVFTEGYETDPILGNYFSPRSKFFLIEVGGIGAIRLRPRRIDNSDCWLGTALVGSECHGGIPLAIPDTLLRRSGVIWGDQVNLRGRVRYLQDAGLRDVAASVHHARPLIVFVEEMEGVASGRGQAPIVITPVSLFEENVYEFGAQFTFVSCAAGQDSELDAAAEWIEKYAAKHSGRVITNFDEQRPILADAPLSYQRLVAKTYDRAVIERLAGPVVIKRVEQLVQETVHTKYVGGNHVTNNIKVGGSAIINIDSVLTNVTQTIGAASGLDSAQKSQLEALVQSLKAELDTLKASHADETKEIAEALEKAVTGAAKPPQERKKSLLQLSAKGLKDAAELVKDIAPTVLTTADRIAKFIVGL